MSDDEEESEEEVVQEQQPVEIETQQFEEPADEEAAVSTQSSPVRKLIGYAMGIQYSLSEKDFGNLLNNAGVQYKKIECELIDNKFCGKAKVFFEDSVNMDNFLKLNDTNYNGFPLRTKVWEERGGHKNDRQVGGRRGGNDRGDRRGGDRRGDRDGDYARPARRPMGTSDVRNLGDDNFPGRGGPRREYPNRSNSNRPDKEAPLPSPPAGRPKLNLQPRTLPVETIGKLNSPSSSSIFGAGKAQDVFEYEQKAKETDTTTTNPPPAPSTTDAEVAKAEEGVGKLAISVGEENGNPIDDLIDQPPTATSTTSQKSSARGRANNHKDKKRFDHHVKVTASQEESSQPEQQQKDKPYRHGNGNGNGTPIDGHEKKKYKDNKGGKKDHKKKENGKPAVEETPKVEEDVVPSDFTVISSKSKAKVTTNINNASTPKATTTTGSTGQGKVVTKNAFAAFDSDSD